MKKFTCLLLSFLIFITPILAQNPCEDETYLELKNKKRLEMADIEYKYYIQQEGQCSIYNSNSSKLSGIAQNYFISGHLNYALYQFEQIIKDYPNSSGAIQSIVYLLSDAITNNNLIESNTLLSDDIHKIEEPIILSSIYKIKGDMYYNNGKLQEAIKYYEKACLANTEHNFKLDLAMTLIIQKNYKDALEILNGIIINNDINFSDKNRAEEMLGFSYQKLRSLIKSNK